MLLITYCIITITVTFIVYVVFLPTDSKISDGAIETHNIRKANPPVEKSLLRADRLKDSDIDNELYYAFVRNNPTEFDWSSWEYDGLPEYPEELIFDGGYWEEQLDEEHDWGWISNPEHDSAIKDQVEN
eukprot:gene8442-10022_t